MATTKISVPVDSDLLERLKHLRSDLENGSAILGDALREHVHRRHPGRVRRHSRRLE
jgi:predicted transcriptional regulator